MHPVRAVSALIVCAGLAGLLLPSCNQGKLVAKSGLRGGMNYMQPLRWRMTMRYRVQEILPDNPFLRERPSEFDPKIPAVGRGTYEVWLLGPREGEEIRDVKLCYAQPEPTLVTDGANDTTFYYYDLSPDGNLPLEASIAVQWEFLTFERYAHWDGMPTGDYDKGSELYRRYTSQEDPIVVFPEMEKLAKDIVKRNGDDHMKTALACYNHVLAHYDYDFAQSFYIAYCGMAKTIDSYRCWQNRAGQCDEFANVVCSMLRSCGIPSRPVYGIAHSAVNLNDLAKSMGYDLPDNVFPNDFTLLPGGHAWAEFYLPEVGWIPLDPTWGMYSVDDTIDPQMSPLANLREISWGDYYFGKSDAYRITLGKNWHVRLTPPPKTPGAEREELWHIGYADRSSGVRDIVYGWEGIPALRGG